MYLKNGGQILIIILKSAFKARFLFPIPVLAIVLALAACASPAPTPSPTIFPSATMSPTAINTTTPTPKPVSISINETYYQIEGTTAKELRKQLNLRGPVGSEGNRVDGQAIWNVSWAYPYSRGEDGCSIGPLDVQLAITIILPQWQIPDGVPPDLVKKWNVFLAALRHHEDGHKWIVITMGEALLDGLSSLPAYPSCVELEEATNTLGNEILDQYNLINAFYDTLTDHGKNLWVVFP